MPNPKTIEASMIEDFYETKRYWYHVSTTLKNPLELLKPRDNYEGFNRSYSEPNRKRICVSPTLEHCLTAIPYGRRDTISIYRTERKVFAKKPIDVFDASVTMEGWLTRPIWFFRIGILNLEDIRDFRGRKVKVKAEVASDGNLELSKDLYKWWVHIDPWKFVKLEEETT